MAECLGCVDVWSTESGGEPIHYYQHLQRVCALDLSADVPVVTSASGSEVRVDTPDDRGYWRTVCLTQLAKPVSEYVVPPRMKNETNPNRSVLFLLYHSSLPNKLIMRRRTFYPFVVAFNVVECLQNKTLPILAAISIHSLYRYILEYRVK